MGADPALETYEVLAAIYNDFNHANHYEDWLGNVLLPELQKHGLPPAGKALDVGCGTGRAFQPLLRRGWRVEGCDLSPAMIALAAEEGAGQVLLSVADMRELPLLGHFDLVLCLNDSVNYLLGDADLISALSGMGKNLASNGLLVFDVATRSTYESNHFGTRMVAHEGCRWTWTGLGEPAPSIFEAEITGDRLREPVRNLVRFRSETEVRNSMGAAGIEILAVLGMSETGAAIELSEHLDESRDYKLIFIGIPRKRSPRS